MRYYDDFGIFNSLSAYDNGFFSNRINNTPRYKQQWQTKLDRCVDSISDRWKHKRNWKQRLNESVPEDDLEKIIHKIMHAITGTTSYNFSVNYPTIEDYFKILNNTIENFNGNVAYYNHRRRLS